MEIRFLDIDLSELSVGYFDSFAVETGVDLGLDFQSFLSGRVSNQVDNDFMAREGFATPVHAYMTKHAMLNLVPFTRPWWKMTNRDAQSKFVGQALQRYFPQPGTVTITAATICCDKKFSCFRIDVRTHFAPPAPQTFHCEFRCVVVNANTHPANIGCLVIHAIGINFAQFFVNKIISANQFRFAFWPLG